MNKNILRTGVSMLLVLSACAPELKPLSPDQEQRMSLIFTALANSYPQCGEGGETNFMKMDPKINNINSSYRTKCIIYISKPTTIACVSPETMSDLELEISLGHEYVHSCGEEGIKNNETVPVQYIYRYQKENQEFVGYRDIGENKLPFNDVIEEVYEIEPDGNKKLTETKLYELEEVLAYYSERLFIINKYGKDSPEYKYYQETYYNSFNFTINTMSIIMQKTDTDLEEFLNLKRTTDTVSFVNKLDEGLLKISLKQGIDFTRLNQNQDERKRNLLRLLQEVFNYNSVVSANSKDNQLNMELMLEDLSFYAFGSSTGEISNSEYLLLKDILSVLLLNEDPNFQSSTPQYYYDITHPMVIDINSQPRVLFPLINKFSIATQEN